PVRAAGGKPRQEGGSGRRPRCHDESGYLSLLFGTVVQNFIGRAKGFLAGGSEGTPPRHHPPFLLPRQGEETEEVREIPPPGGRGDHSRLPRSGHHRKSAVCRPYPPTVQILGGEGEQKP